ncbi:MAG: hypothetical protein GPOALKHO_000254 [Sodalis sp.]|nr:MAG: hypothetical protein GPOALKHO_000254 [Sodalis sp.]
MADVPLAGWEALGLALPVASDGSRFGTVRAGLTGAGCHTVGGYSVFQDVAYALPDYYAPRYLALPCYRAALTLP